MVDFILYNVCSGQESAGIVMGHGDNAHGYEQHRMMGLVTNVFTKDILMKLKGNLGIGNTSHLLIIFPWYVMYMYTVSQKKRLNFKTV